MPSALAPVLVDSISCLVSKKSTNVLESNDFSSFVIDDGSCILEKTRKVNIDGLDPSFKGIKDFIDGGNCVVPEKFMIKNGSADVTLVAELPIVDMKSQTLVDDLAYALETTGIFYLVNHGVELKPVMKSALDFFKLPSEHKMEYWTEDLFAPIRYCTSMTPSLETNLEWHDHLQMWFPEDGIDSHEWPAHPQKFKEVASNYVRGLLSVGNQLLSCMSKSLGLEENAMKSAYKQTYLLMRANYYPPCPNPNLALGMDGHTDSGGVTLLLQDDVGGLQIKLGNEWANVKPLDGSFVINMGDQIEKLSNGRFKSVLHRVMVHPTRYRLSIASFASPAPGTLIGPIKELLSEETPSRYKSLPYKDYINEIYTKHFAGKNVYDV